MWGYRRAENNIYTWCKKNIEEAEGRGKGGGRQGRKELKKIGGKKIVGDSSLRQMEPTQKLTYNKHFTICLIKFFFGIYSYMLLFPLTF